MSNRPLWLLTLRRMVIDAAQLILIFIAVATAAIGIIWLLVTYVTMTLFLCAVAAILLFVGLVSWFDATYITLVKERENGSQASNNVEENSTGEEIRRSENEKKFAWYGEDRARQSAEKSYISDQDFYEEVRNSHRARVGEDADEIKQAESDNSSPPIRDGSGTEEAQREAGKKAAGREERKTWPSGGY